MKKGFTKLMETMLKRKNELIVAGSDHTLEKLAESELAHGDALDVAEHSSEQEKSMAMRIRSINEIKQIDDALEKMHKGVYGICTSCEETIETKRLKAMPFVKYCLDCQEENERFGK